MLWDDDKRVKHRRRRSARTPWAAIILIAGAALAIPVGAIVIWSILVPDSSGPVREIHPAEATVTTR